MRLVGGTYQIEPCPTCKGKGKVLSSPNLAVRTKNKDGIPMNTPGDFKPIPCPECQGKKTVLVPLGNEDHTPSLPLNKNPSPSIFRRA